VKSDCFCIGPFIVQDNLVDLSADKTSRYAEAVADG